MPAPLTQAEVRAALDYNPDTGILTWRKRADATVQWNGKFAGKKAGTIHRVRNRLYRRINLNGSFYYAHRLIFLWMTGEIPDEIDHEDRDGLNNRWLNLRPATHSENMANVACRNPAGFKGIYQQKSGRWGAKLKKDYRYIGLGTYDTPEEAAAAYMEGARQHFGDFATDGRIAA